MGLLVGVQGLDCECIRSIYQSIQAFIPKHKLTNFIGSGSVSPFSLDYKPQIVMIGPEQVSAHRSLLWKVGELPLQTSKDTHTMLTRRLY